jgi:N-acetylglucosaminyldiphosphoundecaprenol N-acetyl-beta-D-mannosaminyltransferase
MERRGKRAMDITLASLLLVFVSPVERWRHALVEVLRGDLSFVGPRPAFVGVRSAWSRSSVRPGLFCTWWIRQRSAIAYGSEAAADCEYVESRGAASDLGILLRAAWAAVFGKVEEVAAVGQARVSMLGVEIDNLTVEEAIPAIVEDGRGNRLKQVSFVNPHCLNIACKDESYRSILNQSDVVLADGIGLLVASRWLRRPLRQNVNGTDLFPELCGAMSRLGLRMYLLGAQPGVAERAGDWVRAHYPELRIAGCRDGFFVAKEEPEVLQGIAESKADVLLVALGVPGQEKWIHKHCAALASSTVRCAIGVGGLFDFYSGRIPRAPLWMREAGLEWTYRLYQEPGRLWRRYLVGNTVFLARVLRERVQGKTHVS